MATSDNNHANVNQSNQTKMNVREINTAIVHNNIIVEIKPENMNHDDLANEDSMDDNPFENIQLEIKREILDDSVDKESSLETEEIGNISREHLTVESNTDAEIATNNSTSQIDIKQENAMDESLVSYDYPNFDDGGSMDSAEATALGNVETCLEDSVKKENYDISEENQKLGLSKVHVKEDPELIVTDTHLICNNIINTTSTVTSPQGGLVQSNSNKATILEVHPIIHSGGIPLPEFEKPEEILPTVYNPSDEELSNYDDVFQLNSITGNELSLEQEAYGLLRAKGQKIVEDKQFTCPKCPKVCKTIHNLKRHIGVHDSIDKRALGVLKGQKTRFENRIKRLKEMDDQNDEISNELSANAKEPSVPTISGRKIRIDNRNKRRTAQESGLNHKGVKKRKKKYKDPDEKFSIRIRGQKEEVCKEDIKEYEVKVVMQENTKKEGYQCTCGNVFQRKSRLETCLRSHNLLTDIHSYSCQSCTKQFNDKNELALHRRRIHRKRFPCKFCPTDYNTRQELFNHLQIHRNVQLMEYKVITEVMKGKQKLRCFMCVKTCTQLSDLKSHVMEDHKEPYVCPHCQGMFSKIIDFANHTKTFHPEVEGQSVLDVLEAFSKLVKAWKCEECELQFHEADKLALHQVEKHSPELKTESQFQCDDCRRVFVSQKGLTSHRRIHHDSMEETEPVEQGIMCIECRKICKDESALTSHMRFHSPERKYPCRYCDFRFATPEKRKAHAEIHTGDMKFVCFICEYQCSSENRLNQHKMSVKHLNMRELLRTGVPLIPEESTSKKEKCKDTSKKKRSDKRKDEDTSSDKDNSSSAEEFPCDICGDKFSSENEMLDHKQTHPFIVFPNEDNPTRIFFK